MNRPFDDSAREEILARCRAFTRVPSPLDDAHAPLKRAAVAVTLVDADGSVGFLLTRRAPKLRSHGGQWALPGGRCDAGESAERAALRELHEEVGLEPARADVLGLLDDYPTRSGYLITPVVVWVHDSETLRANPDEVASIHRIALGVIARPDAVDFVRIPESERDVVRVRVGDRLIHAPTAAVLYQFRELLVGRSTRVAELEQPRFAWR